MPADPAGRHSSWRPSLGYLVAALVVVVAGVAMLRLSPPSPSPVATGTAGRAPHPLAAAGPAETAPARAPEAKGSAAPPAPASATSAARPPARDPGPQIARTRDPDGDLTPDLADFVNPGERPTMAEVIDRLHQAGVYGGLGAFAPPGTRPPMIGLAVPEDFVLPEGYVRHYQATDDGQRLEPILMFSPDSRFVDAARRAAASPGDRVVPPDLAPPGLPIRHIVIPAATETGK